ncbi:MAG: MBL fold metallo-hydrolase [Leptolyngbyaceae cyanobacterium SL_7_1]|nr:MBL fold metallo-hydrolase [Leptolyngbyaceae cyanobacterium SL_7_1]
MPGFEPTTSQRSTNNGTHGEIDLPQQFTVNFWGVRGSVPTPGFETIRYGGNTACVELRVANQCIIFDAGTGLRRLGKKLLQQSPVEAHLFFTHTHWDRIQGFPFFMPAFQEENCFHIYGSVGLNGASIKQRLYEQMLRPNFPVPLQVMQADLKFNNIAPGSVTTLGDVVVETISLNRSNGALGYRVTWNGRSLVYATDTEYSTERVDQSLLYLAHQADLLIYDAVYADYAYYDGATVEELRHQEAWKRAIETVLAADVKQVIMFHHDPAHEDDYLDQIEAEIQSCFSNVWLAREGMVVDLIPPLGKKQTEDAHPIESTDVRS